MYTGSKDRETTDVTAQRWEVIAPTGEKYWYIFFSVGVLREQRCSSSKCPSFSLLPSPALRGRIPLTKCRMGITRWNFFPELQEELL